MKHYDETYVFNEVFSAHKSWIYLTYKQKYNKNSDILK